jgi:DNA invertase Pin-like site-specific DNA recombinase
VSSLSAGARFLRVVTSVTARKGLILTTRMAGDLRRSKADRSGDTALGIEAQRAAILAAADRRDWEIVAWYEDDGISGRTTDRPGLQAALAHLASRKNRTAEGLVAAKLDRLSRSVQDFSDLLDLSRRKRFGLAVLDFDLDTTTATGRLIAGMVVQIAQWEREMIGERTKAALAVRRSEGVVLGHPSPIPADVQARIVQAHSAGRSFSAIARGLDADSVPTPSGAGRWHHSVIAGVVQRWSTAAVTA